jgi:cytochrome bd ubiquinol oxidase subunit I
LLIPLQILAGDLHGLNTLEHQPAKIAAMEGIWDTERGAAMRLFAWPNESTRSNDFEISVPKLASLILTHDLEGEVRGLNDFEHHPPVAPLFWGFRLMVGIGMLMLAVSWLGVWQIRRRGEPARWLQRLLVPMAFSGWVATLAGWYVTEIGRQPWLVYGVLSTADAASSVPAPLIGISLGLYLAVYAGLLAAYVSVLFHLMRKAMHHELEPPTDLPEGFPAPEARA